MISEFSYYAFPALYFWWQKNLSIAIVAPKPNPKKREGKFSIQISRWALDLTVQYSNVWNSKYVFSQFPAAFFAF